MDGEPGAQLWGHESSLLQPMALTVALEHHAQEPLLTLVKWGLLRSTGRTFS